MALAPSLLGQGAVVGRLAQHRRLLRETPVALPDLRAFTAALLVIICYLLPQFRASGELLCGCHRLDLPLARHVTELDQAPIVELTAKGAVTLDGRPVDEERLWDELVTLRSNFLLLHPGDPFLGNVLLMAEKKVPFGSIAAVLRAVRGAGYREPWYVVADERMAIDWTWP